jgi:hypothetical protein
MLFTGTVVSSPACQQLILLISFQITLILFKFYNSELPQEVPLNKNRAEENDEGDEPSVDKCSSTGTCTTSVDGVEVDKSLPSTENSPAFNPSSELELTPVAPRMFKPQANHASVEPYNVASDRAVISIQVCRCDLVQLQASAK